LIATMRLRRRSMLAAGVIGAAAGVWTGPAAAVADIPALVAASKASVLPVGTYNATDSPRFSFRGTGFVIGDGTLLATNFHVLPPAGQPGAQAPLVVLTSTAEGPGQPRGARVIASDRWHDLALLQIDGPPLSTLKLAEAGSAREGQAIVLIGFPIAGALGFAPVTHRGIVASITTAALPAANASQLDPRALNQLRQGNFEFLQLDATAYPGNSGGPLLDAETGQVLGIVNMVLVKGGRESALSSPTGISYAVPVRFLHELLKQPR
jgi:S1-C subfamily serine protease